MAGDGPLLKNLDKIYLSDPSIRWFGRLERSKLVALYQQADLFVFPSNTDTFGMSVLEAQLCGLPAIVSMKGGPKEIIQDHETGLVCSTDNPQAWLDAISYFSKEKDQEPDHWKQRKTKSRAYAIKNRDWKYVLPEILELKEATSYSPYVSEIALTV